MNSITFVLPTVDCIFKKLFGEIADLLADLICSFEKWPVGHIKKLTYANTEYTKSIKMGNPVVWTWSLSSKPGSALL